MEHNRFLSTTNLQFLLSWLRAGFSTCASAGTLPRTLPNRTPFLPNRASIDVCRRDRREACRGPRRSFISTKRRARNLRRQVRFFATQARAYVLRSTRCIEGCEGSKDTRRDRCRGRKGRRARADGSCFVFFFSFCSHRRRLWSGAVSVARILRNEPARNNVDRNKES